MALKDEQNLMALSALAATIAERRASAPDQSYTAKLMSKGIGKCAQKTGEEAVEFVIAAVSGDAVETSKEAADLIYHLLVTLELCDVALDDVLSELAARRGISGLEEKASRPAD